MEAYSEPILSKDSLKLHVRSWLVEDPAKVVCIIHGLGEHSGRYLHVADYLVRKGMAVLALDLRGHGQSKGKRGHARSYELLLSDIEELLKAARAEYTEIPIYLMGHSLGGNLVANYMIRMNTNEVAGFILSAPWFRLAYDPPAWKVKLGRWMSKIWRAYTEASNFDATKISKVSEEVEAYQKDPLVHDRISAGFYLDIVASGQYALDHADEITVPGLVYHGTGDEVIDWKATESFAASNEILEWRALSGVYHEPHNDTEKEEVLKMIGQWLVSQG